MERHGNHEVFGQDRRLDEVLLWHGRLAVGAARVLGRRRVAPAPDRRDRCTHAEYVARVLCGAARLSWSGGERSIRLQRPRMKLS